MWGQVLSRRIHRRRAASTNVNSRAVISRLESLESRTLLAAFTVQLSAARDNTIYSVPAGDQSNGSGQYIVAGGASETAAAHRGLVLFGVDGAGIPDGSTILDAVLRMNLSQSVGGAASVSVHRLLKSWGESGSDASGNEFEGAAALAFDATWLYSMFDGTVWSNPGGDFAGASASESLNALGTYEWTGGGLVGDVQLWLDNPGTDFGWLVKGAETPGNIKAFDSRDSGNSALSPVLEITYEEPVLNAVFEGRKWHDRNADGLREHPVISGLNLQFQSGRNFYNAFRGQEYWYRSATDGGWYFLTPNGNLTRWDGQPGKLTGQIVQSLDPRTWYNPETLIGSETKATEPWMNGFIFELLNDAGAVVETTSSRDIDLNRDGIIQEEAERGWYRFDPVVPGDYTVREVLTNGWVQSASVASPGAAEAYTLDVTLGLSFTGKLYENFGGKGERWLKGTGAPWFFVTPIGDLIRWNGVPVTAAAPLAGTWIASPGIPYFRDVSLLHSAGNPVIPIDAGEVYRLDFGNYQPVSVSGRTWIDNNPDGKRNSPYYASAVRTRPPDIGPPGTLNYPWYVVLLPESEFTENGSNDFFVETFFYVTPTRQIFRWSPEGGSVLVTSVSGKSDDIIAAIFGTGFVPEPWVNDWSVELLDDRGNVVARTNSTDLDVNDNGEINVEQESGWYQFPGLLPGNYAIRSLQQPGTVQTSQSDNSLQPVSSRLQAEFGFRAAPLGDHYNFGARHERWFQGRNNQWFFITPAGTVFEWNMNSGGVRGPAAGRQVAQLSASFFLNLNLLFQPKSTSVTLSSQQIQKPLNLGSCRVLDSLFASLANEIFS